MDEEGREASGEVVSNGPPGLVCAGITLVPVEIDVGEGVGLLVDDKADSELDQVLGSGSKAMHDLRLGPRGVGMYRRRRGN